MIKALLWKQMYGGVLDAGFERKYASISSIPYELYEPVDLNEALLRRVKYSLPQLLREEDRSAMAFGVEARLPFLDYRLVQFLLGVPAAMKIRGGRTKYLLRKSMAEYLPAQIAGRTGKLGFSTPMDRWLREPTVARRLREDLKAGRGRLAAYVDWGKAVKILEAHLSGRAQAGQMLWKLWNLALWFRLSAGEESARPEADTAVAAAL